MRCHVEIHAVGIAKPKFKGEKKRQRTTISIRVPKDELENGAEVLNDLIDQAREKLGRPEGTPPYYILSEALYGFLT